MTLTEQAALRLVHPSAYVLLRACLVSSWVMFPAIALALGTMIFDFHYFVANWWIGVVFFLSIASVRMCAVGSDLQASKELDRGYTSLLYFGNEGDVRDPRDGHLLRVAGQPFQPARSMTEARDLVKDSGNPSVTGPRLPVAAPPSMPNNIPDYRAGTGAAVRGNPRRSALITVLIVVLVVTFVLRLLIVASQPAGRFWAIGIAVILAVGLGLTAPIYVYARSIRVRNGRIQARNPAAFVVPAYRTVSLVGLLSRLLPGTSVFRCMTWVFDSDGCSLWLGRHNSEEVLHVPWALVASVEQVSAPSDKNNLYPAVAINTRDPKMTGSLTFFPSRSGPLTFIRMPAPGVASIIDQIRLRMPRVSGPIRRA